jgi:DNA-binding SARP family transcriptional activator
MPPETGVPRVVRVVGDGEVQVNMLGPLELSSDGVPLALGAPKQKAVLGLLLARMNSLVSVEEIIDELWGERPPQSARANARLYAANLRRMFEKALATPVLTGRAGGYMLALHPAELDLPRFRERVRQGREAMANGDFSAAVSQFDQGLVLWRGPALADVPAGLALASWRMAVEEERLCALEERAEVLFELRAYEQAAGRAAELLQEAPLRERAHAVVMRARYQAGDIAGALAAFDVARRGLAEHLGVDPGEELVRLQKSVLNREPITPRGAEVAPGNGTVVPRQLPADRAGFTGRRAEMRCLDAQLIEAGTAAISVIHGMAGVGKTALAMRWAHQRSNRFPDGQLYVNLHGFASGPPMHPAEVLTRFLRALGMPSERVPVDVDAAAAEFRSRTAVLRLLIVLDNACDSEQVRPLLPASPGCCTVITSRDQLTGLVATDGVHSLHLGVLTPGEAVDLLGSILGDDDRTAAAAAHELAALCGWLPLALRIAAANLGTYPDAATAHYVAELRDGDRLGALAVAGDPQVAVRTAFDVSYRALPADAAQLFRLLGLVPALTVSTAAVAALSGLPEQATHRLLGVLTSAHLVERPRSNRFAMHDLLVTYARERAGDEETGQSRRNASTRLTKWYLSTVAGAVDLLDPHLPRLPLPAGLTLHEFADRAEALAWLDTERVNILAVINWVTAVDNPEPGWILADAISGYLHLRGCILDRLSVARAALSLTRAPYANAGARAEAAAHLNLGHTCVQVSRYDEAIEHCERAVELSAAAGWAYGEAAALTELSVAHGERGAIRDALDYANRSLAISRAHDLRALLGKQLNLLGVGLLWRGALAQAESCFAEALHIHHELGSVTSENSSAISLAQLCLEAGKLDQAMRHLDSSLELARREGEVPEWPRVLNTLAAVHCNAGRYHEAVEACRTALPVARRKADRVVQCSLLNNMGEALAGLGRLNDSADGHWQALEIARTVGTLRHQSSALLGLARYHRLAGELEMSQTCATDAVRLARESGLVLRVGLALTELARTELRAGTLDDATKHAEEALWTHQRAGHRLCEVRTARLLDDIAIARES